jgi:hypothetical protein
MNVCGDCQRFGARAREVFSFRELVHILSAVASMRRHLDANIERIGIRL